MTLDQGRPIFYGVSIGEAIRNAREAKGWTQVRLAEQVGAAPETICRWEMGHLSISRRSLIAVEALLGRVGKVQSKRSRKGAAKS